MDIFSQSDAVSGESMFRSNRIAMKISLNI